MKRGRQRWTDQTRSSSRPVNHRDGELRLNAQVPKGPDMFEKLERLGITPEQHVLTVIDNPARFAVGERGRAAAQPRSRFEDENARAPAGHPGRRAQPCEPGADNDCVVARQDGHSHCFNAIVACMGRGTRTRSPNTS